MPNISPITLRIAASGGGSESGSGRNFGDTARARLLMRHAGIPFTGAIAIIGALAGCEEGFPGYARRVVDPGFFGLGIAAGSCALLDDVAAGLVKPRIDLLQFLGVLDLNSEMIEAGLLASGGDRKIHPRVLDHPLGVVGLDHAGLRVEQRRIEADRSRK